jgi:hypothetical protein
MKTANKYNYDCNQSDNRKERANELKEAFNALSPFIEKHTTEVCPDCESVCCRDKHGRYDQYDLVFLKSLGEDIPADQPWRQESDSCRYMTGTGCSLERWKRPFRCTHFFCDPLLKSLENDNAKLYRSFVEYFQYLLSVRQKLIE